MSKTDSAFETTAQRMVGHERSQPIAALEARAAVAEAIVAVKSDHNDVEAVLGKVDPADLAPRYIHVPPVVTPPVVLDSQAARDEMARFDTTKGRKPTTFQATYKAATDGYYHVLECDGHCGHPFGCARDWQPDEIAGMEIPGLAIDRKPLNRINDHGPMGPVKLREKTSAERKGEPIHSGVLMYFPDAIAAVARLSKAGNDKHNPGEPLHWARGKSIDQMDCLVRHSLTRDKVDPETRELEAVAQAWRALAELQLLEEARLHLAGIIPYSGVTP